MPDKYLLVCKIYFLYADKIDESNVTVFIKTNRINVDKNNFDIKCFKKNIEMCPSQILIAMGTLDKI